jgi:hypothetical protein
MLRKLFTLSAFGAAAYALVIRPWHQHWGATPPEADRTLPGDRLIPDVKWRATHAITIDAPPAAIWPWIVQIGQGRGGFYTYEFLENMMDLDIRNADRILPEHQALAVGDAIPLAPDGPALPVAEIEPNRYLLLHGDTRDDEGSAPDMGPGQYLNATWLFYLEDGPEGTTRLIERFQMDFNPSPLTWLFYRVFLEPGSFIMERGMLLGLKRRVEAAPKVQPQTA